MADDKSNKHPVDQRLPYEPPQVISEQSFETQALSCSKTSPGLPPPICSGKLTS